MSESVLAEVSELAAQEDIVLLAKVGAPYGIEGFNRIQSFTDPLDNILTYKNLLLGHKGRWRQVELASGRLHGKSLVAKFKHVIDRDEAQKLTGQEIAILRSALPDIQDEGYYWVDLEGLTVETQEGVVLGKVAYLYDIADNSNMLVTDGKKERHIPFVEPDFVTKVCFESKRIIVDWDPLL